VAVCSYIREGSPYFWLKYPGKEKPVYESSRILIDDPEADWKLAKKINKIERTLLLRPNGRGWEWVPKFFEMHHRNSANTLRIHRNAWNFIAAWLRERKLDAPDQILREHAFDYIEWRMSQVKEKSKRSPRRNTALYEVRVMRRVLKEAVLREMCETNVFLDLGLKRDVAARKPEILPDQQEIILDALQRRPDWMHVPFRISLQTGLRRHETHIDLHRDVNWDAQRITVPDPKGGVARAFTFEVMQLSLLDFLAELRNAGNRFAYEIPNRLPKPIGLIWRDFFDELGMTEVTFHCTRVTFITWCHRSKLPREIVMQLVNHADEQIHRIYQRLDAADVRAWRDPATMAPLVPQLAQADQASRTAAA
jgi:hypothetical protein